MAHHDHAHDGDAGLADLLDLDGTVLRSYWSDVLAWVRRAARGTSRAHILDLGAGSGVGTIALAQRFADADVLAVDRSADMLGRIRVKALDLGLAHRVRTMSADLDRPWPAIAGIDVTWASMSLHHLADPDRVLGDLLTATRPGGLLAVAELAMQRRFLPDDLGLGRPGLESRCLDALTAEQAHTRPELGSDWATRLGRAGFTVFAERTFTLSADPGGVARYAQTWLGRLRSAVAHRMDESDRDTLGLLLDSDGPHAVLRRGDLQLRGARTVTLARRPAPD